MNREKLLRYYLFVFGFANLFLLSFAPILLGDLLLWSPRNIPTELMIASIYFAMGITMLITAKKPLAHKSFIDFVVVANVFHSIVMIIFAQNIFHLSDAAIIGLMGVLPVLFYPWGLKNFLRYPLLSEIVK
jgi:hypothetical protein